MVIVQSLSLGNYSVKVKDRGDNLAEQQTRAEESGLSLTGKTLS
jgi:hypothetical protein